MGDKRKAWTPDPSTIMKPGDPPSQLSVDESKAFAAILSENAAMRDAILNILQTWSHLEGELSQVVAVAADIRDPAMAAHIFFASNSTHTQKKMLDGVISHLRRYHHQDSPLLPAFEDLFSEWKALRNRYNQLKEFRDAAAHRIISTIAIPDQANHIVLSPSFQNIGNMLKAYENDEMMRYSSIKMSDAAKESIELLADVTAFLGRLRAHLRAIGANRPT